VFRLSFIAVVLGSAVLLATQSRSGIAGALASAFVLMGMAALRRVDRRRALQSIRWVLAAIVTGLAICLAAAVLVLLMHSSSGPVLASGLATRLELWQRSIELVQDFAFTGIGPGQFNAVLPAFYPPFLTPADDSIAHAHDVLLEYAVELGVPGAVAFCALLVAFVAACRKGLRAADDLVKIASLGALLGLFSFAVFGVADAIAPGARGGLALWIILGLGGAVGVLGRRTAGQLRAMCAAKDEFASAWPR
jgi:putative inorganic carbon (HCO3(-)) transporter